MSYRARFLAAITLLLFGSGAVARDAGITPAALTTMATSGDYRFTRVSENPTTEGIRRQVLSFEVDGLHQCALLLWPAGEQPQQGWPVLQFNHGFHPDPPRNGFNAEGESDRPGDYYRETAQAFARAGFAVVVPDYRGHNISDGGEFTSRVLADAWYSRDAVACFLALDSLEGLDMDQAYMLGHSMGGAITLRALLALGPRVKAGALWSSSGAGGLATLMGKEMADGLVEDHSGVSKPMLDDLRRELQELGPGLALQDMDPLFNASAIAAPISIQHAAGDASTSAAASMDLAARLYLAGKNYQLKIYPGSDHLFTGENFATAVERDIAWFRAHR